ncbi:MAG: hypothetical protein LC136_15935 [Burkholderiales bacterium]|nr:hypothetical protein [Burkholderiaceae bacterium]MCL4700368.1 hypothetical protein [Burkholderiaceae bacterium]MCZ2415735.1 hypothetical protein [Burkholderiales bacterium]MDL1906914.1 hypothetical protein [Betaproteobacteria bacterium PRO1]
MLDEPKALAGRGRLGHRALAVEVEHRLGGAGALFGHPTPAAVAGARSAVAGHAVANEIDMGVLGIRVRASRLRNGRCRRSWKTRSSRTAPDSGHLGQQAFAGDLQPFVQSLDHPQAENV